MSSYQPSHQISQQMKGYEQIVSFQGQTILEHVKEDVKETLDDQKKEDIDSFLRLQGSEWLHPMDISFEKQFLTQHIKVLEYVLSNTKESMSSSLQLNPSVSLELPEKIAHPYASTENTSSFLKCMIHSTTQMTIDEFISDLKRQTDLDEFLKHIIQHFTKQLSIALIIITIDLWAQVRKLNLKELELKDLRRKAHAFTKKKLQSYSLRTDLTVLLGNLQSSQLTQTSLTMQKFKDLLRRFSLTILLICGGFFENPYTVGNEFESEYEVDYPKRQSSSVSIGFLSYQELLSDSELSGEPTKKRKTH